MGRSHRRTEKEGGGRRDPQQHPASADTPWWGAAAEIDQLRTHLRMIPTPASSPSSAPAAWAKRVCPWKRRERFWTVTVRRTFPSGIFLVELAAATAREEMLAACAAAFGFALEREPEPLQQISQLPQQQADAACCSTMSNSSSRRLRSAADAVAALQKVRPGTHGVWSPRARKLNLTGEHVLPLARLGAAGPGHP
jgi:hypothetical protein